MLIKRKPNTDCVLAAMLVIVLVIVLVVGCSVSTYKTAGSYTGEMRLGRYTLDEAGLANVRRVALLCFATKNCGSGKGEDLRPIAMNAFNEYLTVFKTQDEVELVPLEEVIVSPEYQAIQALVLPDDIFSPFEGLTYIREGVPDVAVAELCEAFDADAVMTVYIYYDWDFTSWNAAKLKKKVYTCISVPPDGHAVWKRNQTTWTEIFIKLPTDFKRLFKHLVGLKITAEEWDVIINTTAELSYTKQICGSPAYFFLDDAKAAREAQSSE